MNKLTKVCLLAAGIWLAIILSANVSAETLPTLYNYHEHSDSLISSGQPARDQFVNIRKEGVDVVVNLSPYDLPEAIPDEKRVVESAGMQYFHLAVDWDRPSLDHLKAFFSFMDDVQGQRVLVHCWANARASAFVYLYRTLRQGKPEAKERRVLRAIWANNEGYELRNVRHWRKFLRAAKNRLE